MYSVGDEVTVIPPSYKALIKFGFREIMGYVRLHPEKADEFIELGGSYTVSSRELEQDSDRAFYRLMERAPRIPEKFLELSSKVEFCPYQAGDVVKFDPKSDSHDLRTIKSILMATRLNEAERRHEVTHVINNFFIFVDYGVGDPETFPFRWDDFRKINGESMGSLRPVKPGGEGNEVREY
jgi:hypothetical protein